MKGSPAQPLANSCKEMVIIVKSLVEYNFLRCLRFYILLYSNMGKTCTEDEQREKESELMKA